MPARTGAQAWAQFTERGQAEPVPPALAAGKYEGNADRERRVPVPVSKLKRPGAGASSALDVADGSHGNSATMLPVVAPNGLQRSIM
ncbi:hypothetical protein Pssp01_34360 [Pseudomonas sp. NBRC 100443]|nr:hypothetical protein Pssp01_34360 [Pseudomonas sp. NBRC 100443]